MPAEQSADQFFSRLDRLGWLTPAQRSALQSEVDASGEPPLQVAVRMGLLESSRLDIMRVLLARDEPLPGYEVQDVLGIGGMGVVYRARQKTLDRIVAIKTIQLKSVETAVSLERFEQEARALARLQHPHIVSAIDFGRNDGRVYLVMEFIDGTDLQALLKKNVRLSERRIWTLLRQAAQGLAYASRFGIVHRDIKPGNLMLIEQTDSGGRVEDTVKIADFGLARLTDEGSGVERLTSDGMAVGTPPYMAPEQLQDTEVDFRADIYALGATAYHLLSGKIPFSGLQLTQIVTRKLNSGPVPLAELSPTISPESAHLVEDMMRIDPAKRPDYPQLLRRIDAMLPGLPESSSDSFSFETKVVGKAAVGPEHDTVPTIPFVRLVKRRPVWMAAAAVALVAGVASIPFLIGGGRREVPPPDRAQLESVGPPVMISLPRSLTGWDVDGGQWQASPEEPVIVGKSGAIRRAILDGNGRPLEAFQFDVIVDPLESEAAEVEFGIQREGEQLRYVCRLTPGRAELGRRRGPRGAFEPFDPPRALEVTPDREHAVLVERQPAGWFVDVDDQPLSGVPHHNKEWPEIRLAVDGGPAHFSDIELSELRVKTPPAED